MSFTVEQLAAKIFLYGERNAKDRGYANSHANEAKLITAAWNLLLSMKPDLATGGGTSATEKIKKLATGYFQHIPMGLPQPVGAKPKPLFTPQEEGMLKQLPAAQRSLMEIQIQMQHEALMMSTLSNIMKLHHDTLKGVIGNIR
jgi:hypothetical protein